MCFRENEIFVKDTLIKLKNFYRSLRLLKARAYVFTVIPIEKMKNLRFI